MSRIKGEQIMSLCAFQQILIRSCSLAFMRPIEFLITRVMTRGRIQEKVNAHAQEVR